MADDQIRDGINQISQLREGILELLRQFQNNRLVDAHTKEHQKTLEKTLLKIDKVISKGAADQRDIQKIQELLIVSEKSLKETQKQTKSDELLRDELTKEFGEIGMAMSAQSKVLDRFGKSLGQMFSDLKATFGDDIKQASTDALSFSALGPVLGFSKDYINSAREYLQRRKESKLNRQMEEVESGPSVQGQFHRGMSYVPSEGTYLLDEGERVIPPEQNKDLTRYLAEERARREGGEVRELVVKPHDSERNRLFRVYEEGAAQGYFDPIIENDNRLFELNQIHDNKFQKQLGESLNNIEISIWRTSKQMASNFLLERQLAMRRFMRFPIWNTLTTALSPLTFVLRSIREAVFGRKRNDTEQIVKSNDRILEFMRTRQNQSDKTPWQRFFKNMITFGGVTRAQETRNRIERDGYRRGFGGLTDRMRMWGYRDYIDRGTLSDRAVRNIKRGRGVPEEGILGVLGQFFEGVASSGPLRKLTMGKRVRETVRRARMRTLNSTSTGDDNVQAENESISAIGLFEKAIESARKAINKFAAVLRAAVQNRTTDGKFAPGTLGGVTIEGEYEDITNRELELTEEILKAEHKQIFWLRHINRVLRGKNDDDDGEKKTHTLLEKIHNVSKRSRRGIGGGLFGLLGGIGTMSGVLMGGLVSAGGSLLTGALGGLTAGKIGEMLLPALKKAGPALGVALAGGIGVALGTWIYDLLTEVEWGQLILDHIGEGTAKLLALFGNDEAQESLERSGSSIQGPDLLRGNPMYETASAMYAGREWVMNKWFRGAESGSAPGTASSSASSVRMPEASVMVSPPSRSEMEAIAMRDQLQALNQTLETMSKENAELLRAANNPGQYADRFVPVQDLATYLVSIGK